MPSQEQNASASSPGYVAINVPIAEPVEQEPNHNTTPYPDINPRAPLPTRTPHGFIKVDSQISPFGIKSEKSLQAIGMSNMNESEAFPLRQMTDHLEKLFGYRINEEEKERGFRLLNQPDPLYLGFVPSKRDKRPYLNAMALVDTPEPGPTCACHMPITASQGICVYGTWLLMICAIGGILYGLWYIRVYIINPS